MIYYINNRYKLQRDKDNMKKKTIFSIIFCMIVSVCVLFTGCGGTDLSGVNSQIAELQQQLSSLNQRIIELNNKLQNAEGNITSLQSQLAIASANYDKLSKQVYGTEPSYKKLNETTTYSYNGIKLFDITPTQSFIGFAPAFKYDFNSKIVGLNDIEKFGFTAVLYVEAKNDSYVPKSVDNEGVLFSYSYQEGEVIDGIVYFFVDNNIFAVYQFNFASTSN